MVTKMKQNMAQNLLRKVKNYSKIPDWTKNKQNGTRQVGMTVQIGRPIWGVLGLSRKMKQQQVCMYTNIQ